MASSSPQSPAPDFSAAYEDETPAPPGWKRQLVPRMGKGLTPKKTDVVYIAPNGEEIKSKTQLQRYLKAHKDGPAMSEFKWSSGDTPRRSARLTSKTPTDSMESEVTPKGGKRKSVETPQEEANVDQAAASPKRAKKARKSSAIDSKDVGGGSSGVAAASIAGNEETMKDVEKEEKILLSAEVTAKPVAANGDLEVDKKEKEELEDKASEENANDKSVEEEIIETANNKELIQPEEKKLDEKETELSEPISAVAETTEVVPELVSGKNFEVPDEKDDKAETVEAETKYGEPLEPLTVKITKTITEVKTSFEMQDPIDLEKEVVESPLAECSLKKEEQEQVSNEANHHAENYSVVGISQDQEKGSTPEANHSTEPVDVSN